MIQSETLELLEWSRLCQHLATFAATKLGATAARQLRIPTAIEDSEALLDQTREVYHLETVRSAGLRFDGIQDVGDSLERAEHQGVLSGEELLNLATTLSGARQLRRAIDGYPELTVLNQLVADLRTYPELEQEIHHCIDDHGDVTNRASPKLEGIREQLKQQRDRIYGQLQRIIQRQPAALQETLITQRGDRFVLPVKSTHKDAVPGIVHDASASGATLYVEPHTIVESGNRLRQLLRQEQVEEEAVRRRLSEQVAAVKPDLERLLAIVTTLDLATARARYSLWLGANSPRFVRFGTAAEVGAGIGTEAGGDRPSASPEMPSELSPETQSADRSTAKSTDKSTDESIVLRQLRHPLLIWQQQYENGPTVVPIDLVIQPSIRVVAITGPNTGGKTVTLKTLGLAVLMAKAGLFVPAREPVELPWFEQVLADIGDEQSLQQSLSTFSGHVRRISRILNALNPQPQAAALPSAPAQDTAQDIEPERELLERDSLEGELPKDKQDPSPALPPSQPPTLPPSSSSSSLSLCSSLVLLDEVGAGTDPSEGSALAIALLHYLADHAALTIATTHFGELKALKYQDPRFENASVEFDDVSLSPTYRLLWGIPGRSNALAIARRLGLNEAVIAEAQTYAGMNAAADVNQVIAGLEAQRRQQEEKAQTAAQLVQQAERLHQEVARKADLLKQRERELQVQQEQAIQTAIAMAKTEIAQVIRKLQKGNTTAQDAQQATDALQQIAEQRLPSRQQPAKPKPGFRPQVGDRVRIPRLGQVAEVLTNPDDDGELSVRFGLMKMTVSLTDVESLQGEKAATPEPKPVREKPAEKAAPPPPPQAPAVRTSRNTLDIRGNRVGDAEVLLEKAIAHAPAGPLWIIHGHGTGKLKKGVHEFLQRHPQISRFEDAEQSDGGTGVTVAYVD